MLVGAHVSTSGGLTKAAERGVERECEAIQVFNQSPRMWRPTAYGEEDFAAFREAIEGSGVQAVLIHAVYLLNCASEDPELAAKSKTSLLQSLRVGAGIGAAGVVLHPGSALKGEVGPAIERAGRVIGEALAETEGTQLHLENTAGTGGTLGRSFEELAALIEAAGGDQRLGVCLDSCHLYASGYDVRTAESLAAVLDDFDRVVGIERLHSLHYNDSAVGLGSNRDRHADPAQGELGVEGTATFLSEPRFDGLPMAMENPGPDKKGTSLEDVRYAKELREQGQATRAKAAAA
jgi:deoxyribonuclease IV